MKKQIISVFSPDAFDVSVSDVSSLSSKISHNFEVKRTNFSGEMVVARAVETLSRLPLDMKTEYKRCDDE